MSDIDAQAGGAYIKPSARPSIHSHCGCPFAEGTNMVRYGLHRNDQENDGSQDDQGMDVVDNAMSKHAHPIRSPSRQNKDYRRNSLEPINNKYSTEEYDYDALSKSVPATLPSQLYCSNTTDDEQEARNENRFSDISYYSVGTPNRSNLSRNASNAPTPKAIDSRILDREQSKSSSKVVIYLGIVVALCAVVCTGRLDVSMMSDVKKYDKFSFYTDLSGLGEKYNVDEDSILQVQTGISTIFEKQDAGSFIFVYNSKANNFKLREFNKFVNDISYAASKYLRNDSTPLHYTVIEGTRLDMEEHSELICRYREQLTGTGVMLVRHLEAIPSDLAMAFHYYCDEYNPLVKKSAIFFTLNLDKCPQDSEKKSLHAKIEKCLTEKWEGVPLDSIGPLLTRVVSVVIDVTSAF